MLNDGDVRHTFKINELAVNKINTQCCFWPNVVNGLHGSTHSKLAVLLLVQKPLLVVLVVFHQNLLASV